jgi:hypothetical protein
MAYPISTSSDIPALAVSAFQSSSSLYQVVTSLVDNETVRELKEELEDLNTVLEVLQKLAIDTGNDLLMLRLPLLRCGNACKEFEAVIVRCMPRPGEFKIRDWIKLRYTENDMRAFKNQLARFKSTIMIAVGSVNM